jgi:hypothetical protein
MSLKSSPGFWRPQYSDTAGFGGPSLASTERGVLPDAVRIIIGGNDDLADSGRKIEILNAAVIERGPTR